MKTLKETIERYDGWGVSDKDIIKAYITENDYQMSAEYGSALPSHRYYLLTADDRKYIFGYDSIQHQPSPIFKAELFRLS